MSSRRPPARQLPLLLSAVLLLLAPVSCAAQVRPVDPAAWVADVAWLADDARQGRDTDSPQLLETAQWVAEHFAAAGLAPMGDDGGWLQHFKVPGSRRLIDGNALELYPQAVGDVDATMAASCRRELDKEWMPLQSALNGSVRAPVVFAGYGLSDAEGGWDDYAGLDVKGKIALVLRRGPRSGGPDDRGPDRGPPDGAAPDGGPGDGGPRDGGPRDGRPRFGEGRGRGGRISFVSKVNAAFQHGAAALIVVNDPRSTPPGSERDVPQSYRPLAGDGVAASLPAASLTAAAGVKLFKAAGLDLEQVQRDLDAAGKPQPVALGNVSASLTIASEVPMSDTVNVLGWLPGNDPALANEYVLIGAHMDHVGLGMHATSRGGPAAVGQIHNGADDNASGTAGVVELARVLAEQKGKLRRGVVLATWSGEEWGLLGSHHYAESPARKGELIAAVNMDMIGRGKDGYVVVEGMGSSPGFRELVVAAHDALGLHLDLNLADAPSNNSDHASFFDKKIPVVNFFTGLHDDYHMPSDDVEKIDSAHGAAIATLAGEVVRRLSALDVRPPFTEPPAAADALAAAHAAQPAPRDGHNEPGEPAADAAVVPYRVVFGSSPDMGYRKEDGVRVSGVRKDTPAEKAGLLAGDIITALDGQPIRNLEDYSVLLFRHQPGDEVTVTVRRGEQTLDLKAVLTGQPADS